ncbi:MAG: TIGR03118 family protein [Acidobacteriaceae bacterium]|jgi:uncharacterized protein (TIGR03118 family)
MPTHRHLRLFAATASLLVLALTPAFASTFDQTDIVSSVPGLATTTDANLINPWGMSFSATSPFWISNQGTNTAILTSGAGILSSTVVSIPTTASGPQGPTGQVAVPAGSGFQVGSSAAHFIFDSLNGTITAWAGGTTATVEVPNTTGAVYTGLALATSGSNSYLYAADAANGVIRVFNSSYAPVTLSGNFVDPNLPIGYVPFNIQLIGSDLYVTYADLVGGAPVPGSTGFVDVYDTAGDLIGRVATGGALDAPWGITLAPAAFGTFGGDLLIGNFGNGEIDAYSTNGTFEGAIDGANGLPLVNQDLWALDFANSGTPGANPDALYFTAGIDNQTEGLFGDIVVQTPEPSSFILAGMGLLAFALTRLRPQQA